MSTEQPNFNNVLIALEKLLKVDTLEKRFEVLRQHPELQSEATDIILDGLIEQKRKQDT